MHTATTQRRVAAALDQIVLGLLECGASNRLVTAGRDAADDARRVGERCWARASLCAVGRFESATDVETIESPTLLTQIIDVMCVGQTLASLDSFEAAAQADDEDVASLLEDRADSEVRRAQFGWSVLRWLFVRASRTQRASLLFRLDVSIGAAMTTAQTGTPRQRFDFSSEGFLAELGRKRVVLRGLATVVEPCARALPCFAGRPASRSAALA